jgi:TrpR family trp operon transcriptional repressor
LVDVFSRTQDKDLLTRFLKNILTPSEINNLVLRWELVKLLDKGVSQREIGRMLGISLCKITRGSRELKKKNSAIKKVLKDFTSQECK